MPLYEAGDDKQFFCRRCAVGEELCHHVKELQEEVDRVLSIQVTEKEID